MSQSLAIHQALSDTLHALSFPIYKVDADTCSPSLTGEVEKPSVMICQIDEEYQDPACKALGRKRTVWTWEVRIRFNNLVCLDELLEELALKPPRVSQPDVTARDQWEWVLQLESVEHSWRPSQDAGPGTSAKLKFVATRY